MIKSWPWLALAVLSITLLACEGGYLRRSESSIATYLLKQTPAGTARGDVKKALTAERVEYLEIDVTSANESFGPPRAPNAATVLRARLGIYGLFFRTHVVAFYSFGPDDKLIHLIIEKHRDSL